MVDFNSLNFEVINHWQFRKHFEVIRFQLLLLFKIILTGELTFHLQLMKSSEKNEHLTLNDIKVTYKRKTI